MRGGLYEIENKYWDIDHGTETNAGRRGNGSTGG
jgi:hypothetical protein